MDGLGGGANQVDALQLWYTPERKANQSFSRFPTYVDHVLLCCRAGTDQKDTPNLAKLKVIS